MSSQQKYQQFFLSVFYSLVSHFGICTAKIMNIRLIFFSFCFVSNSKSVINYTLNLTYSKNVSVLWDVCVCVVRALLRKWNKRQNNKNIVLCIEVFLFAYAYFFLGWCSKQRNKWQHRKFAFSFHLTRPTSLLLLYQCLCFLNTHTHTQAYVYILHNTLSALFWVRDAHTQDVTVNFKIYFATPNSMHGQVFFFWLSPNLSFGHLTIVTHYLWDANIQQFSHKY